MKTSHKPQRPTPRAADRIRAKAGELFYAKGIRAVGVDEIVIEAGATKPSLYRSFASKDELAAAYLTDYGDRFWARFDEACAKHPRDARAQILEYLGGLAVRASRDGYRGCGITNAAVEYPEPEHPARKVSKDHKRDLRQRLRAMAAEMGAEDPAALGDGLMLLMEGAFVTGQLFGEAGPARAVATAAAALIDAATPRG